MAAATNWEKQDRQRIVLPLGPAEAWLAFLSKSDCSLTTHLHFRHHPARSTAAKASGLCLILIFIAALLSGCSLVGPLVGAALPFAGVKMAFACLPEGTMVDTPSGPRAIERLATGDLVIGYSGDPVRILQQHSYLENPATRFLRIGFDDGAAVELCEMHRLAGTRARNLSLNQTVAGREITAIGSRCGVTRSFDLLTEDAGYRIDGLPVNSMIEEMVAAASGMREVRD